MIKISKKVEYALMALKFIDDKGEGQLTSAREICEQLHTPFDTMAKVMQGLNSAGILHSIQGVKGGYKIARPLEQISYLELTELVEKKRFGLDCIQGNCELHEACNISSPMHGLNQQLTTFFTSLNLKELFNSSFNPAQNINKVNSL